MKHGIRIFWLVLVLCGISACGGDSLSREGGNSSDPSTPAPTGDTLNLALALVDASGNTATVVAENTPLTLNATLTNQDGDPVTNTVVSFEFSNTGLAVFNNDTGTALTDANGVASIVLTAGESSGSGTVVASVDASSAVSTAIGFTSQGAVVSRPTTIALTLTDSNGNETNQLSDQTPLTINALLTDQSGTPLVDQVINFTVDRPNLVIFANDSASALTNAQGIASITISVDSSTGSGVIQAVADSNDSVVSTVSFTSLGAQTTLPASLDLLSTSPTLESSGLGQVEIIAIVKDESNILLKDVPIAFSVNLNGALSKVDSKTGDDGTARAFLSTQNDPTNRDITVNAAVQNPEVDLSQSLMIGVVGTSISISSPNSMIIDDSIPVSITLTDSNGNAIAGRTVTISASNGTLSAASALTDAQGVVNVNFTATASGEVSINASALNASDEKSITVQQDDFSFSVVPSESVNIEDEATLTLRWYRDGAPYVNGSVEITSSRGAIFVGGMEVNSITTGSDGRATFMLRSPAAGPSSVSALGTDSDGQTVTARADVSFIASIPDSIAVDATPDVIGPDGQTSTITAIVRDDEGNLVEGQIVDFTIIDTTGGSISPNTAITDESGTASTVYTSNAVSSDDGIEIIATSGVATGNTFMTVGDRAFDITIGTGNDIQILDSATYLKEFSVFVTDASSRPISDAELSVTASVPSMNSHRKGDLTWNDIDSIWEPLSPITPCHSEDANHNQILDLGEDFNNDGELTPGNVVVVTFKDGVSRTNAFGQAIVQVIYPKQYGFWNSIELSVFGQSLGSESKETQRVDLPFAAEDWTERASKPPISSYGINTLCESTD